MIKEFYTKRLLIIIIFVLMLLMMCVTFDYAENNTITNINNSLNYSSIDEVILPNNTSVVNVNDSCSTFVAKSSDKIYTKYSIIGMYAKPSCGCRHSYTWHYREFINYCPNCKHYNTLRKNPKRVPEREYTCSRCSSDFCGVCGKEKMGYSKVYLKGV